MIIIDGQQSDLRISNFANLEDIINGAVDTGSFDQRVVTEVRLNDRLFSELYPHQSSDIDAKSIQQVEIISMPVDEMALAICEELFTVLKVMDVGSKNITRLFQENNNPEALSLLGDLLDITRHFMGIISLLRSDFIDNNDHPMDISKQVEDISALLAEMTEAMESSDWLLLADMIEFEFTPQCKTWDAIVTQFRTLLAKK